MPREPLSDPRPRAVAVVERDGKVLVIRRHLDGRDYAVLPGGGIEDGEAPAEAALRELREECTLDGQVAELLLEGDHGGRTAFYYRVTGVEGEPVLGGEEAEGQDATNQHHPMWASPKDLELMGLLPEGSTELVVALAVAVRVRAVESPEDWAVVEHLWQPYSHDLSEFRGSTPGPDGTFKRGHLDFFRPDDPNVVVYLAVQGDRPVGFALVRGLERDARVMGEFFVVRSVAPHRGGASLRRAGGAGAPGDVVDRLPGGEREGRALLAPPGCGGADRQHRGASRRCRTSRTSRRTSGSAGAWRG